MQDAKELVNRDHPVVQSVSDAIQSMILQGKFKDGDILPSQRLLSETLSVSRASVREALSMLAAFGLVSIRPGRGVFVRHVDRAAPGQRPATWRFDENIVMRDAYQARLLFETFCVRQLAEEVDEQRLSALEKNVADMMEALRTGDFVTATRLDFEFHWMLLEPSNNSIFLDLLSRSSSIKPPNNSDRVLASVEEHRAILRQLQSRSPAGAAEAMQRHIRNAARRANLELVPVAI